MVLWLYQNKITLDNCLKSVILKGEVIEMKCEICHTEVNLTQQNFIGKMYICIEHYKDLKEMIHKKNVTIKNLKKKLYISLYCAEVG